MKEILKYILIVCLAGLCVYHIKDVTLFTTALYFSIEYFALASVLMYLSYSFVGKDRLLFGVLSGYFWLKLIYNILLYIPNIGWRLGLYNSEKWGFIFTVIIIISLILIQLGYVKER